MKLNQKGFNDVVVMTIIGGIVGSLFILGVFVWQEVARQRDVMYLKDAVNKVAKMAVDLVEDNENVEVEEIGLRENIGWGIYENFNLGFSLKYRTDLMIIENGRSVDMTNYDLSLPQHSVGNADRVDIQVQRHDFSSTFTIDDLIEKLESKDIEENNHATVEAAQEVQLGDYIKYSQYIIAGPGGSMMDYIAFDEDHSNYYHILVFEPGYASNKELVEEIVSSFNFLD